MPGRPRHRRLRRLLVTTWPLEVQLRMHPVVWLQRMRRPRRLLLRQHRIIAWLQMMMRRPRRLLWRLHLMRVQLPTRAPPRRRRRRRRLRLIPL